MDLHNRQVLDVEEKLITAALRYESKIILKQQQFKTVMIADEI
jgi:hypothetical protein